MYNRMLISYAIKPKSQHRTKSTESESNKRIHLVHNPDDEISGDLNMLVILSS